jgi:tetratricopeptide (TPR) repeat protein
MFDFTQLNPSAFTDLCRKLLRGLGLTRARQFPSPGLEQCYQVTLVRKSSDGLFRTNEKWLCVFLRSQQAIEAATIVPVIEAAISARAGYLLMVVFGSLTPDAEARLRRGLATEGIHVTLLTDALAQTLVRDYGADSRLDQQPGLTGFSFRHLREDARTRLADAPWRRQYQTTAVQPARLLPLSREDAALAEADLFRALHGGSFLLLGEPGAGKTTGLLDLAGKLGEAGPRLPLFVPLGRYEGDFWATLGEALGAPQQPVAKATAQTLLASGALVLLLDGINEVQNPGLHARLVAELNSLTDPNEAMMHSRWVVTGRVHDYQQSHSQLVHLEKRRWELQPLSADLVFGFLATALGETQARDVYDSLSTTVREICSNPLLLNMVLEVHQQTGRAPSGRGALYRQFIEVLLRWGSERGLGADDLAELAALLPDGFTSQSYEDLAQAALTTLAAAMSTTSIPWSKSKRQFATALAHASDPDKAAALLLEDLTRRRLLRRDSLNRVSFMHHTVQEYFQARLLLDCPVETLIPMEGVPASQREVVVFIAGMLPDPTPLVERAANTDTALAYEMVRDATGVIPPDITEDIARGIWEESLVGGGFIGANRRWAIRFGHLAKLLDKTIEALAKEIDGHFSQIKQTERLMQYFAELGDAQAQQRALAAATQDNAIPQALLFQAAIAARQAGDHKRVVELYGEFLKNNPHNPAALANRALAYEALGQRDAALADHKLAIELGGSANSHSNYASLLSKIGQVKEARDQLELALSYDANHSRAHWRLAEILKLEDQGQALTHSEQAVQYAAHDDDLCCYYPRLVELQEQCGQYANAITSLRQMIALSPTSKEVKDWKDSIARLRQRLDIEERTRTDRERLQEQGDLPLPTLASAWLSAAGMQVIALRSNLLVGEGGRGLPGKLPLVLLPEPVVMSERLRTALSTIPRDARTDKKVLVLTAAETLTSEAHNELAALQDEFTVALVTALEVRDAFEQGDPECRNLIDRAFRRAGQSTNPYEYTGVVQEHTEFFGRAAELNDFTALLGQGQLVGLFGIHKIGKSSLLEQVRRKLHLSHPEITIVSLELNASVKDAGDFYRQVLEKLPGLTDWHSTPTVTAAHFRQTLTKFHQQHAQARPNHRLLLQLDEYAYLIPTDGRGQGGIREYDEVLGLLKALHREGWLLVLACGRTAALNRQASWGKIENPFVGMLKPHFLNPLPPDENDLLMTALGRRGGLTFTPAALRVVYDETGGHPLFSRMLGTQILRAGRGQADETRVRQAVERFLEDRDQRAIPLAIYEERLDEDEQAIVRQLALAGPLQPTELFPAEADVPRRRQIRDALANLIDTTVLTKLPDGRVAHRYGLMRRVIQREQEELGLV